MIQELEHIPRVLAADSASLREWKDKDRRVAAMSALSLAGRDNFRVYGVRNSKHTLLGVAACYIAVKAVMLAHLGTRDSGQGVGTMLVNAVIEYAKTHDLPVKTVPEPGAEGFYEKLGWRKVGQEYWSI